MLQKTQVSPTSIPVGTWLVDPNAGRIAFAVKTMWGLVDVKGTFERFEGALTVTETGSTGELVVHTESLDTKNERRDKHLRGADFFDSQSAPRATFVTTAVTHGATGAIVTGELTVGATKTHLELPVEIEPFGDDTVTVRTSTAIPREDVGLEWNMVGMIKGDARLDIELSLIASA